jgi:hypothetical protein
MDGLLLVTIAMGLLLAEVADPLEALQSLDDLKAAHPELEMPFAL